MKKTYKIEVDCANCANLMEDAVQKIPGVASVIINFMTQKMIIEFDDWQNTEKIMEAVLKTCRKIEPDCDIML